MAVFRNRTTDDLDLKHLPGAPYVEADTTFEVPDELVLEDGHRCDAKDHKDHPHDARIFPESLFERVDVPSRPATRSDAPATPAPVEQPAQ